jgi:hypothetical protein
MLVAFYMRPDCGTIGSVHNNFKIELNSLSSILLAGLVNLPFL